MAAVSVWILTALAARSGDALTTSCVNPAGWTSGIKSNARLPAMTPASSATLRTSPLAIAPSTMALSVSCAISTSASAAARWTVIGLSVESAMRGLLVRSKWLARRRSARVPSSKTPPSPGLPSASAPTASTLLHLSQGDQLALPLFRLLVNELGGGAAGHQGTAGSAGRDEQCIQTRSLQQLEGRPKVRLAIERGHVRDGDHRIFGPGPRPDLARDLAYLRRPDQPEQLRATLDEGSGSEAFGQVLAGEHIQCQLGRDVGGIGILGVADARPRDQTLKHVAPVENSGRAQQQPT